MRQVPVRQIDPAHIVDEVRESRAEGAALIFRGPGREAKVFTPSGVVAFPARGGQPVRVRG